MTGKTYLWKALLFIAMLPPLPASAREEVRGVTPTVPELRVIDEKCLTCHNRKRIDNAVQDRKNMESILSLMEKKGAVLSDNDRRVIGHFWEQKLFREKKGEK